MNGSRAGTAEDPRNLQMRKDGSTQLLPRTALLIRGSKPDPRRVRTGAQITRVRGDEARAFEPFLEPAGSRAPHMSCSRASEGI
jgi:hypothetical protein